MGYSAIVSRLLLPAVSSISDDSWLLELVAGDDLFFTTKSSAFYYRRFIVYELSRFHSISKAFKRE